MMSLEFNTGYVTHIKGDNPEESLIV